ncbi:heme A synthase [Sphingomonas changbaiensis NBRC 104936]|uniref:Heme A synthase n=1 Tax=Sphingomonas changbaiensis NBRC 104936 TaxID=1219043 RepID=A0A0E9MJU9_9SPHN|nr:COX15/CtaA family protein [Sphingomonas changbaiensis]GAO38072.1 heme A synthase [Sphingomonas changbaiensis NBRC 104936]
MTDRSSRPLALSWWLLSVAALVFLMVVVGGITRLTESGLSITEWKPVSGALPPVTHAQWERAFELYQGTTQYQALNRSMTLGDFQFIFFWEFIHRLLGRLIGVAFALPLVWFAAKRQIPRGYGWRLVALLALGGLQGAIGWWMVESGLAGRTEVSHYRLAVHLMTALFIFAGLIWTALDLRQLARDRAARPARLRLLPAGLLIVLAIQILLGAWTAGLRAGLAASDWPLMNGRFFPEVSPNWPWNMANDPFLVQWEHRWWAWVAVAALVVLARLAKRAGDRRASIALHTAFGTQILLGIATIMTGVDLPVAVLHQAVAVLVVASATWCAHSAGRRT